MEAAPQKGKGILKRFLGLPPIVHILLIVYVCLMLKLIGDPTDLQWDYRSYFESAKAYAMGQDPYSVREFHVRENLLGSGPVVLPYVYPPPTLLLFRLYLTLGDAAAPYAHLTLITLALSALLVLWAKGFIRGDTYGYFTLFCLFAYNQALPTTLLSGNISAIEELLIWAGFYMLIKKRPVLFCACILATAAFKLTPILFLALLPLSSQKNSYKLLVASLALFGCYLIGSYMMSPTMFAGYVANVKAANDFSDSGAANPSTVSLIKYIAAMSGSTSPLTAPLVQALAYILIAAAVLMASIGAYSRLIKAEDTTRIILLSCIVYSLLLPRLKDYSLVLLFVPTYYIFTRPRFRKYLMPLTVASILPIPYIRSMNPPLGLIQYYPLFLAYLVWAMHVTDIRAESKRQPWLRRK